LAGPAVDVLNPFGSDIQISPCLHYVKKNMILFKEIGRDVNGVLVIYAQPEVVRRARATALSASDTE
jgi:hypothetical protein